MAALSQASRLTVAEDPILKSDPAGFASAAVNRRRCSCPCSYVFLCRRVSSPLLRLCISQIYISSLAQCFGGNVTPQREVAVRGVPSFPSETSQEKFLLKVVLGELLPKSQSSIHSKVGFGEGGRGSPALDGEGCRGLHPQPAHAEGSPRPQRTNHRQKPISCCFAITLTGFPTSQPLSSATAPFQPGKRHFSQHWAGRAATARWLAVGFALQQLPRQS